MKINSCREARGGRKRKIKFMGRGGTNRLPKLYFSIISGGGSAGKGEAVQFISGNKSGRLYFIVASKLI
jgi:hypothetical protein